MHEDWNANDRRYDADIAILTFEKEVTLNEFIGTVCLPQSRDFSLLKKSATIVGWGVSERTDFKKSEDKPRKTFLKAPPTNEACFLNNTDIAKISSNRTFCAGGESAGPCFGDSVKMNPFHQFMKLK